MSTVRLLFGQSYNGSSSVKHRFSHDLLATILTAAMLMYEAPKVLTLRFPHLCQRINLWEASGREGWMFNRGQFFHMLIKMHRNIKGETLSLSAYMPIRSSGPTGVC